MIRTIKESIAESVCSGLTSWSMESPNTRIWVHMDMGAWVLIYGCIYGMGHHMDIGVLEAYSLIRLIADEIECESVVLFSSGDRR